jgi:predicted O-linked N-acetylglucosamine transferase (SPINDLY family)
VQANYLGYPGTAAVGDCDYLIADSAVIPPERRRHYLEKILYLPDSYQPNDSQREIAARPMRRGEMGLPEEGIVFCCFNRNLKLNPETLDGWSRILLASPGSVLWLLEDNLTASGNLRKEAAARGVDPPRLVFAKKVPHEDQLARHRLADLFLDTLPCNAHTTASDALWAGLPVLTRIGDTFAGRVGASLLTAIGLPEMIVATQEEYEATAIDLAANPDRLRALKEKLARNRLTAPLFDVRLTRPVSERRSKRCTRADSPICRPTTSTRPRQQRRGPPLALRRDRPNFEIRLRRVASRGHDAPHLDASPAGGREGAGAADSPSASRSGPRNAS